jgi:hypothetical protein
MLRGQVVISFFVFIWKVEAAKHVPTILRGRRLCFWLRTTPLQGTLVILAEILVCGKQERLREQLRSSLSEDFGQDILVRGHWQGVGIRGSFVHGGVLQCLVGMWVVLLYTQGTPPFSTFHPQHSIIFPSQGYRFGAATAGLRSGKRLFGLG